MVADLKKKHRLQLIDQIGKHADAMSEWQVVLNREWLQPYTYGYKTETENCYVVYAVDSQGFYHELCQVDTETKALCRLLRRVRAQAKYCTYGW